MQVILFFFEMVGVVGAAISGSIVATKKGADVFGVLFLGVTTAIGGGIFRDVFIGRFPPIAFVYHRYIICAAIVSLLTFTVFYLGKEHAKKILPKIDSITNFFDAIGLGAFTIVGIESVLLAMPEATAFLAIFFGMFTGVGGGIVRDVLVQEMPFVLHKRIYALASLLGACLYWGLLQLQIPSVIAILCGIGFIVILRLLAAHFKWDLPKVQL